ncbi:pyruvate dehydrogenase (quinone) [Hydrogenophaga palleronii]|uniref:Pyruvate dehydrogenase (Quinone) n=1 Tax=Hydrogenophaga palleronii TaxID=65655 RepID=A0ABU1WS49_9BURK|nr:thiamine pyrophosphate-requiring protein [Hydrogenophaga palleronii]MDR7152127.1 pyruvate dehydrogenase (quinone) [Hydrogenophaga palleronii]
MTDTVSDFILDRLHAWGVRRIFGYPGDGINGLIGAMDRARKRDLGIEYVQTRHEELAAFMACAHAKFTGEVGVCLATSGPGAIHLLNGLYDAKLDHQPVVAIVGQQARAALGGDYQQEVDLLTLFKDVAHEYVQMATVPAQVRHLVDRAVRIARDTRSVTCLIVPHDLQELDAVRTPPREHGTVHSGIDRPDLRSVPPLSDLERAAEVLNAGKKVAILVGAGALQATDEVIAVANQLGAGVAKALLGKAALPDDLPYVTGCIGLLGTQPGWQLMSECDTLLMVGSGFPYSEFLPEEGQARGVQIDIDPRMLSLRYPMEVGLVGDSRKTLHALLPLLERKTDLRWRESIEQGVARWWQVLEARAKSPATGINPQLPFWELSPRLPDDCILTCDSGSAANWYARDLKIRRGMMASLSGGLATMGPAIPYALAAKHAHPDRHVIALLGDGAMQMNGVNALISLAAGWEQWRSPAFTVMVLNNGDLNQVTWEQRAMAGDPKFEASQRVPDFPYAEYARLIGLKGLRVTQPEDVAAAWDEALASDTPMLLEMVTDPNVPPLPPHINAEQATAFLSALWHRDPEALEMVKQSARQWWDTVFPAKAR